MPKTTSVKKTTKVAKPSPKKAAVSAPKPKAAPAKTAKPAAPAKAPPAKPAPRTSAPAKAPAAPKKAGAAPKAPEPASKSKGKAVAPAPKKPGAAESAGKGISASEKKGLSAAGIAHVESKKAAAAKAAADKVAAKAALAAAKAAMAADKKNAAAGAKNAKSPAGAKKGAAHGKGNHSGSAPQAGHGFLAEPGPRFRSPFSGSASTAKAAAAKMAELAGLTAIRAASVKQGAPVVKKFKKITESPLPEKQLEEFKQLLMEKRDQLVGDVSSMEREALGGDGGSLSRLPQHMADQGTDTYDQSLNLDLAASQRGIVKEIDAALARIANKTFGVCELLGKPIGIDRLRNAPWTRYSIEAARMLELNPELARVGSGGSSSDSDDDDNDDGDDEV